MITGFVTVRDTDWRRKCAVPSQSRKVIELGYADPKRIGVIGHSYGGEGAAYIGVMSKMFAAVGMGAGVVDLYNDFSQPWGNGMAFYNALRYNGKKAVLLAYPGEGHHLGGLANQKDLTIRFFEFFDHYLKGAPAPKWWTDGLPYLNKLASREPAK